MEILKDQYAVFAELTPSPVLAGAGGGKGEECTGATALTVRAALQHVVEDLEAWAAARGGRAVI